MDLRKGSQKALGGVAWQELGLFEQSTDSGKIKISPEHPASVNSPQQSLLHPRLLSPEPLLELPNSLVLLLLQPDQVEDVGDEGREEGGRRRR